MSEPYNYDDDFLDEDEDDFFDCGLGFDGQCALAGSEDCDWECPHSHGPRYCGSNAWHLAHRSLPVDGCECPECKTARKSA